jgi:hypothetical protein
MYWNHGRETWRAGIVVGAVLAAAIGGLAATWPASHPPGAREAARGHPAGGHAAGRPQPAGGGETALPLPSCGTIRTHPSSDGIAPFTAPPGTLTCFDTAARECRAAGIAVDEMGVDTGTGYEFVIGPGGTPCRVTELIQDYAASNGGSDSPVSSTPCRVATITGKGVTIACGDAYTLIPAKATEEIIAP